MPIDKLGSDLFTTIGGGIFLIVIAIVLRAMLPTWKWLRAAVMLAGGIVVIHPMAYFLGTTVANRNDNGWLQDACHTLGQVVGQIPVAGAVFQKILDILGTNLTWIVGAVLLIWTLIHLFPRVWVLLRKKAAAAVHGRGPGERGAAADLAAARGGGVATATRTTKRSQGLHAARHHTTWVALLAPAAVGLVPPLAIAWNLGGL